MADPPKLDDAYALNTADDSRKLYRAWADTYDSNFVADQGYVLHAAVADAFVAAGGRGPVLDMGAGTGMCGQALAQHGIAPIDGTDISPEMLTQAKAKHCYRTVFEGDILAGLDQPDGTYTGVVSSGTFTLGHVGPEGLDEVVRLLKPDGLAVISVRDTHFENTGFDAKLRELEPYLSNVHKTEVSIYHPSTQGAHADDTAILLHMGKR